ncbi:MAG: hypothetical protein A4E32_01372 [Methanomassiliicoccales archaeon PtaU1.Bin124]|nr:MAG: hypothetical protein A4E32_01372 [Methanomassiliicoccales archaeon PtaU1.Bin124]
MKFENGKMYLIEERVPLRTHQILRKELARGRPTLYISKHSPSLIATQFGDLKEPMTTKWLSPRAGGDCIPPMNLNMFEGYLEQFLMENEDGIVVLNGLDVLEMWNGFKPVLNIIKRTRKKMGANSYNFIISLDPKDHYDKQLAELERFSDEVLVSSAEA